MDLGEWTSYLDLHPAQEDSHSVIVLLEARRPSNVDAFQTSAKNIPLAYQVHVGGGLLLSVSQQISHESVLAWLAHSECLVVCVVHVMKLLNAHKQKLVSLCHFLAIMSQREIGSSSSI